MPMRIMVIEREMARCEGELRMMLAAGGGAPVINRKIAAAIAVLRRIQATQGIGIDRGLQASIPTLVEALNLIPETPGPALSTSQLQSMHLSFRCLAQDLAELAQRGGALESQLRPIIDVLQTNVDCNDARADHWVRVLNGIGTILASEDDPNKSVQLVAEMGNSILREA
jgi:hypothetical protein